MTARIFVDSNILLYAHNTDAGDKHEAANKTVINLWETQCGLASSQVLEEFYVNLTKPTKQAIEKPVARDLVRKYTAWVKYPIETDDVLRASEMEEQHKISFWDALILTMAIKSNAEKIMTEYLNHGQIIHGVEIENPFI